MSFFDTQRPHERYVRVSVPALYYFIHQLERANTKQFRMGESVEVGDFALCFKARVLDPGLMTSSMADEVFIEVRLKLEDGSTFDARGRVVWVQELPDPEHKTFLVGMEYTEADEGSRDAFLAKTAKIGALVDPSNAAS
ncbi:MAG: hypothetical protein KDB07_03625 [Planctomycetes bacterium]|nr:hypothetical protein [Planctomycetota bacterium]